jgi:hypothetical protein
MKVVLKWCVRLTLVASLGVLLTTLTGVGRRGVGHALRFEPNPLSITEDLQSGKEHDVFAKVVNESSEAIRLLGSADQCTPSGCFSAGQGVPTVIPAGGQGWVTVHILAGEPGILSGMLAFYTDRPSQPTLALNLRGTIREDQPRGPTTQTANP